MSLGKSTVGFTVRLGLKLLGTLFLITVAFLYFLLGGIHGPVLYRLSANYQGWVAIEYEDPDCPQLKSEGLYLVVPVGPSGDGCTSSRSPLVEVTRYTRYQSIGADGSFAEITKLDGVEEAVSGHTVLRASKAKFHIP